MNLNLTLVLDIGPRLESVWRDDLNQQDTIMATIAEFKQQVLDRLAQLQQASADEHTEVLSVMEALKGQISDIVSDEVVGEVSEAFDAAISGVGNIFTPEARAARKR